MVPLDASVWLLNLTVKKETFVLKVANHRGFKLHLKEIVSGMLLIATFLLRMLTLD